MQTAEIIRIANEYRAEACRHAGVVVLYNGQASGWMDTLRNPEHWMPGSLAVTSFGRIFHAVGGNDYDGAKHWKEVA